MTILVLGGKGKTSSELTAILEAKKIPYLVASRSPSKDGSSQHVRFDWLDESTYDIPFDAAAQPITAVYLVAPEVADSFTPMKAFIDHARKKGVKRFVLLSATVIPKGGPAYGKVHEYLENIGVEYGVVRPSWFMENFTDVKSRQIRFREGFVCSGTRDGKVPFVAARDIAAVAFHLLTDEKSHDTDYPIRGPELLSYDEVAQIISETTGKSMKHERLTFEEMKAKFISFGMPQDFATVLAGFDEQIANGLEAELDDIVLKITGRPPTSFREFALEHRDSWL